uniref:UBC core domain-containing protein n=1 Tax=Macaca fascicularis TaxID=9541 RepID=A0A7N9DHQ0_MACFA
MLNYYLSLMLNIKSRIVFSFDGKTVSRNKRNFRTNVPFCTSLFEYLLNVMFVSGRDGDAFQFFIHVDDPQSGELPSERWNPTQNVRTILLSVISLLNEPNTFSPANVDASVMFRKWRDSKGKDKEYAEIIRKQVSATKASRKGWSEGPHNPGGILHQN